MAALGLRDVVDAADVRMRDAQRQPHFDEETITALGILFDVARQELERDGLSERQVVGAVDLAHAAAAEEGDHAIAVGEDNAGEVAAAVAGHARPFDRSCVIDVGRRTGGGGGQLQRRAAMTAEALGDGLGGPARRASEHARESIAGQRKAETWPTREL